MAISIVLLVVGMVLLIKGADWFVSGAGGIATALKIPPLVIGLTLVSIGTSAPEASVSINGALNGMNDMSIGNVIGSNIFNALFILGVSALFVPIALNSEMKKYDIPIMIFVYVLLLVFIFAISPFRLDLVESIILLVLFVLYMLFLVLRAKRSDKESLAQAENKKPIWLCIIMAIIGLAGVIFGGDIVVDNAAEIAKACGMSQTLVGLTIVAVGTSLPELVTSIVASVKKENDIAVGNVVGSNIFNIIFILGLSSTISTPIVERAILIDVSVMLVSGLFILAVSLFSNKITKWQGALMMLMYVGYLTYIIIRN